MEPVLEIKNLSHVYGVDTPFEHVALDNVSLSVGRGEFVGLIGHTGSGKSTLISLIPRFYDVSAGAVKVDGCDVKDFPLQTLRGKIGLVPQKALLFLGTIRDNLRWGKENATDEELYEALRAAQALEVVDHLVTLRAERIERGPAGRVAPHALAGNRHARIGGRRPHGADMNRETYSLKGE